MRYAMIIRPHMNARYQDAIMPLSEKEMLLTLRSLFPAAEVFHVAWESIDTVKVLSFDLPACDENVIKALSRHSAAYLLCEFREDGSLLPVAGAEKPLFGEDLSSVLKYKGKTNESFTHFLIHIAQLSMRCAVREGERIRFLDPMCSKGTALFEALNMGMDAFGCDVDKAAVDEGAQYLKKYLEYHRMKHTQKAVSMTVPDKKPVPVRKIAALDRGEASFAVCDAACLPYVYGKPGMHIIAADLPYGIQHAPSQGTRITTLPGLLQKTIPAMKKVLLPGGAIALSFNKNTLPYETVAQIMRENGLEVLDGETYTGMAHWVEQAITRDVCVAVKAL